MFGRCAGAITTFGTMACVALLLPAIALLPPTTEHESTVITLLYSGDTYGELESCG